MRVLSNSLFIILSDCMNLKRVIILLLILSVFLSFNAISASEDLNNTVDDAILNSVDSDVVEIPSSNENLISNQLQMDGSDVNPENSRVIYVGQNDVDGNGTYENPFSSLQSARDNVSGEDKVTVNILEGTYKIGSKLEFDTNNLFINGLGNVIIVPEKSSGELEAFSLKSSSANFTINNIIFDANLWTSTLSQSLTSTNYGNTKAFTPFVFFANFGTYVNCTFKNFKKTVLLGSTEFNANFTNCTFVNFTNTQLKSLFAKPVGQNVVYFENCIFLGNTVTKFDPRNNGNFNNVVVNGAWFGNTVPSYLNKISNMKYAVFSVSENYLNGNQFEIMGKLCWNGTDELVGDSFAPMTVTLSSSTGEIDSTATLENGIFRTIYNSTSIVNDILVILDGTTLDLNFNIDNITIINEIINALNRNVESQKNEIDSLNATVNSQNSTIEAQKGQIDSLNGTVNSQAGIIDSQKAEIDSLNGTVNSQAGIIDSQKAEIL